MSHVDSVSPAYVQQVVVTEPGNGLAVGGFVCALVAAVFSIIPFINVISIPLAIIGLALGGVGLAKSGKLVGHKGRGMAIAALVLSIVSIVIFAAMYS